MPPSNSAVILSTGSHYPNHYSTEEMLQALIESQQKVGNDDFDAEFATRVFTKCGFKRHSVALEKHDLFRPFTRSEYLEHRMTNLLGMAEKAATAALEQWGGPKSAITHVFWGTMTGGMDSPTIDIRLTQNLGLSNDVERTSLEGMGCLTGFRLLNLARSVCQAQPNARVLVVSGDLRAALGNCLPAKPSRSDIVTVALFRDSASAAIVGGSSAIKDDYETPLYEMVCGGSRIIPDASHHADYKEEDGGGIHLWLGKQLPNCVAENEPEFVETLLAKGRKALLRQASRDDNVTIPSITEFDVLCHTGGPRVLKEVGSCLGVTPKRMRSSWEVMTAHGNLSGSSNLCILDHHNRELASKQPWRTSEWCIGLSMGPGVCLEGTVLRNLRATTSNNPSAI